MRSTLQGGVIKDTFIGGKTTVQGEKPLVFEGSISGDEFEISLVVIEPTDNHILTLPDASGTIVLRDASDVITAGLTGNVTGNSATATALAANGNNCSVGQVPLGVDANGNAEGCTIPTATVTDNSVTSAKINDGAIVDADISTTAGIADSKLATIATVGKVANTATTAVTTSTASTIVLRDSSGDFSAGTVTANLTGNVTGNSATATALAANGSNCSVGQVPLGVDANGNAEGCTTPIATIADGSVTLAKLADGACSDGQIIKKVSGNWTCATESAGGGGSLAFPLEPVGGTPTLSNCVNGSVSGNGTAGIISFSGTSPTYCTLNFGGGTSFTNGPACIFTGETSYSNYSVLVSIESSTSSSVTFNQMINGSDAPFENGDKAHYICMGWSN